MNLHDIEAPQLYLITQEADDNPEQWWLVQMTEQERLDVQQRLERGYYADLTYITRFQPQTYTNFILNEQHGVLEENPDLADAEDDDPF